MRPLDINDSDLYPTMKEPPVELIGCTEMVFCAVRFEVAKFFKNLAAVHSGSNPKCAQTQEARRGSNFDMEKAVQDLEDIIQQKYINYCDESIPLHFLTTFLARTVICQMRLALHRQRQHAEKSVSLSQSEKDMLFTTCLKMIEDSNLGRTSKLLQRYQWHINAHLHITAMIYVLSELRHRLAGDLANKAWGEISQVYDNHSELLMHARNPVYFEIGNLALKAWDSGAASVDRSQGSYQLATPRFISILRSQRGLKPPAKATSSATSPITSTNSNTYTGPGSADPSILEGGGGLQAMQQLPSAENFALDQTALSGYNPLDINISPTEWEYWQAILDGSQSTGFDMGGPDQGWYPPS
jgi:hypothetical protein